MKIKYRTRGEETLKNIIVAILVSHKKQTGEDMMHYSEIAKIVVQTPRYGVQKEAIANVRFTLMEHDIFEKVNPDKRDGFYRLNKALLDERIEQSLLIG